MVIRIGKGVIQSVKSVEFKGRLNYKGTVVGVGFSWPFFTNKVVGEGEEVDIELELASDFKGITGRVRF